MTTDEARQRLIDGMDYAAYRETDFSLYDSGHYSGPGIVAAMPSPGLCRSKHQPKVKSGLLKGFSLLTRSIRPGIGSMSSKKVGGSGCAVAARDLNGNAVRSGIGSICNIASVLDSGRFEA